MSDPVKEWQKVSKQVEKIGTHVRSHFGDIGANAAADRVALEKALRGILSAVEEAFGAAGEVVQDRRLRQDLDKLVTAVQRALQATIENVGGQARARIAAPVRTARGVAAVKHTPARRSVAPKAAAAPEAATPKAAARKTAPRQAATSKAVVRKRAVRP